MDIDSIKIGGLYSCYHPLEVWEVNQIYLFGQFYAAARCEP